MKKKLMATLTLVMAICSALFVGTAFSASADGYQTRIGNPELPEDGRNFCGTVFIRG